MHTIAIVGTHDTKGEEIAYLKALIERRGHRVLTIDTGLLGRPLLEPGISREAVAGRCGKTLEEILARKDKSYAIETMTRGAIAVVRELQASGALQGIIALGGGQGTVMGTAVMRSLPFGVPKVMVSAVANGQATFGPFVGTRDITVLHSVADVLGLNSVTRRVIAEGAGAVCGMVEMEVPGEEREGRAIGVTTAGVTTACATTIRRRLEDAGFEVVSFHCNGVGAEAMEELVEEGRIAGVVDLSPKDIPDLLYGGIMPAYPRRMEPTVRKGIPYLVIPGTVDFILHGPIERVAPDVLRRKHVKHNPLHTHVRADRREMAGSGRFIAARLARGTGPRVVLVPTRGFSQLNVEGGPLYDPGSDAGFLEGLSAELALHPDHGVVVRTVPLHINDPAFGELVAREMIALMSDPDGSAGAQ